VNEFIKVANLIDLNLIYIGKNGTAVEEANKFIIDIVITTLSEAHEVIGKISDSLLSTDLNIFFYKLEFDKDAPFFKQNVISKFNDQLNLITYNCTSDLSTYLFKNTQKIFTPAPFSERDINEILLNNITYRGMIVTTKEDDISSRLNVVKSILPRFSDKRVLIITDSEFKAKELEQALPNKSNKVFIEADKDIPKLVSSNTKYDVVIEYSFIDSDKIDERRRLVDTTNLNGVFITLFTNDKLTLINDHNLYNYYPIKVANLLSDRLLFPHENWDSSKMPQRIINLFNENKFDSSDKNFISFFDSIKNNEAIIKQIAFVFYKQNMTKLISDKNENISLLNGEPGYKTFKASCISSKQKEE
jgi:hypothetical protein